MSVMSFPRIFVAALRGGQRCWSLLLVDHTEVDAKPRTRLYNDGALLIREFFPLPLELREFLSDFVFFPHCHKIGCEILRLFER